MAEKGVPVRSGLDHSARTNRTSGTAIILDDNLLVELITEVVGNESGNCIDWTTDRVRYHDRDRSRGVFLLG